MANKPQKKIVDMPKKIATSICAGLIRHGKVKVNNLGIFETRKVPARLGRNPQTGDIVMIPKYKKIKFRPTSSLKEAVCKK